VSLFGAGAVVGGVGGSVGWALVGAIAGASLPVLWMRDVIARRTQEVVRDLPVYVDMLTLSLEAGGALSVALKVATERAPDGVLRRAFLRVQGDLRAGRSRGEALQALAERLAVPAVDPLVAALVQAESSGASLASMLRAQADQRLHERFARAEKLALEAPVKMLGPLVLCIFPCTFLVLAFPLVMRVLEGP
jgi:tight adherence protein C